MRPYILATAIVTLLSLIVIGLGFTLIVGLFAFSGSGGSSATYNMIGLIFFLYFAFQVQMIIQVAVTMVQSRYINNPTQRLVSLSIMMATPILIAGFSRVSSSQMLTYMLSIIAIQIACSVWLWVLIAKTKRAVPASAPQPITSSPDNPVPTYAPPSTTTYMPSNIAQQPPKKKHSLIRNGLIIMVAPLIIGFVLELIAAILYVIISAPNPNKSATMPDYIAQTIGGVLGIAFLPCIIIGIIVIIMGIIKKYGRNP